MKGTCDICKKDADKLNRYEGWLLCDSCLEIELAEEDEEA